MKEKRETIYEKDVVRQHKTPGSLNQLLETCFCQKEMATLRDTFCQPTPSKSSDACMGNDTKRALYMI